MNAALTVRAFRWDLSDPQLATLCMALALRCPEAARRGVRPRLTLRFFGENKDRRLPVPLSRPTEEDPDVFPGACQVALNFVFLGPAAKSPFRLQFELEAAGETLFPLPFAAPDVPENPKAPYTAALQPDEQAVRFTPSGRAPIRQPHPHPLLWGVLELAYRAVSLFCPIRPNRVSFFSCRRNTLSGNLACVADALRAGLKPQPEFCFLLSDDPKFHHRLSNIFRFLYLYATSRVVLVDEFFRLFNYVDKRPGVQLIQLWHAAGPFKTVGFSRMGRTGGPSALSRNHRQYDFAPVSSSASVPPYAEAFGLSDRQVLPIGIPRVDSFSDPAHAAEIRETLWARYPALRGKRVALFCPTFRGNSPSTAFYPLDRFSPCRASDALGPDSVLLLKLHPFCRERFEIPPEYGDRIFDFSDESELNDLLFITDLLITDYSSVVFEASLLSIPMLFYAYDLEEYTADRDFYADFSTFVPGQILRTEEELLTALAAGEFDASQTEAFREKYFGTADGGASRRAAALVRRLLGNTALETEETK